jgi:hypothetical protein
MTSCFSWLIFLAGGIFVMVSIIRWFEQVTEAVDERMWNRVTLLMLLPLTVWFFPSRVSAGRPTAVPHHDPAMGFGVAPTKSAEGVPLPPPKKRRSPVDPEAIAKLKQKLKEQGMLEDE